MSPENQFYLGGYDSWVAVNSPQAMIFTAGDDEPTLLLRNVDLPLALETSWISDVRTYDLVTENFAYRLHEILKEKGATTGKAAVELSSYAVPAKLADSIRKENPEIELVDSTHLLGDLRLRKSAAEMTYMREAAHYANLGLTAMIDAIKPGISEIELASAIESTMRNAGSDYWAIPTELSSGPRTPGGHATPRARLIEQGDLIHAEFAGVSQRYHATAIQTVSCGEPSTQARELYDIALESLRAGIKVVKPGANVAEIEKASLMPLRAHGLESAAMMRFGYGVGIAYPPVWLETLQIARGFDYELQTGMTFVLHSCLELLEENLGVIQGGTWVLNSDGLELLVGAGDRILLAV